jgi:deazaflavin-dependent oxidoreductase (nitroreductase family)
MSERSKPRGWLGWFFRMPVGLFRIGLGRFMPWWILLITTGRKSGRLRYNVVDVVKREGEAVFVLAAYGQQADWVRNLKANPSFKAQLGGRTFAARATFPSGAEAGQLMVELLRERPQYTRAVLRAIGVTSDREEDVRKAGERMLVVRIEET